MRKIIITSLFVFLMGVAYSQDQPFFETKDYSEPISLGKFQFKKDSLIKVIREEAKKYPNATVSYSDGNKIDIQAVFPSTGNFRGELCYAVKVSLEFKKMDSGCYEVIAKSIVYEKKPGRGKKWTDLDVSSFYYDTMRYKILEHTFNNAITEVDYNPC